MDRRQFIKDLTALGVAAGVARISGGVPQTGAAPEKGQIPYRLLGSISPGFHPGLLQEIDISPYSFGSGVDQ